MMEARRRAKLDQAFKPVVRGWHVGSEQFRADTLKHVEEQRGKWYYGADLWESAQAKAEQLVAEVLRTEGVPEEQIARWRKGHPLKVSLAARLRAETTVTLDWIAKRLRMDTRRSSTFHWANLRSDPFYEPIHDLTLSRFQIVATLQLRLCVLPGQ